MNPRLIIVAGVVAALAFAGLLGGFLARDDDSDSRPETGGNGVIAAETGFEGSRLPDGLRAPDFDLSDQDGERLRMRDLRGQTVAVTCRSWRSPSTPQTTPRRGRGGSWPSSA
jgi:hypothetical protein